MKGAYRAWPSLAPAAGFLLLLSLVFPDALFGRGVFFQRDIHTFWYPHTEAFVRAVAEGAWPLWNPYSAFGMPALAEISNQICYPLTWLNLVLIPASYFKLYVFAHWLGAGAGLYLTARRWGLARLPAFAAGGLWACSGPLLATPNTLHHFAGLAWVGWVLAAVDWALEQRTVGAALVLGVTVAGQVLAGSADLCVMTLLGSLGYALFARRRYASTGALALLRLGALALSFGLALSAVQWLPTLELLLSSSRTRMGEAQSAYWSLHTASLVDLVVPNLTGELPLNESLGAALFEGRQPFLLCVYLGAASSVLVVLAALLPGPRVRWFALGACVFFILCALGRHAPVYWLVRKLPLVHYLRYPVKYMILASLFWALAAAIGLEAWLRPILDEHRRRWRGVAVLCGVAALLALAAGCWARLRPQDFQGLLVPGAGPESLAPAAAKLKLVAVWLASCGTLVWLRARRSSAAHWMTGALLAVVFTDLVPVARAVNALAPPELLANRPRLLDRLGGDAADSRVYVMRPSERWLLDHLTPAPRGWDEEWVYALALEEMLWPPLSGRWQLHGSYDGILTGLEPPELAVVSSMLDRAKATPLALKILQLGNVGYVVSVTGADIPGLETVADLPSAFTRPIRLLRVPEAMPRAYVVGAMRVADGPEAYAALADPAFDPQREVILPAGVPGAVDSDVTGSARVLRRKADAVTVSADLSSPGFVVLVEQYDPGWRATVDGQPAQVLKANLLFRAVAVGSGHHVIEMRYRPVAVFWGAFLSAIAAALGLGYWELRGRRGVGPGGPRRSPSALGASADSP